MEIVVFDLKYVLTFEVIDNFLHFDLVLVVIFLLICFVASIDGVQVLLVVDSKGDCSVDFIQFDDFLGDLFGLTAHIACFKAVVFDS